ncbi:glycosyltransferase family 2 protein [Parvularcula sp. IMCC14364]|uniref:glycosyltransferase family 2 protein n=1 Tax=Parvularcula sp. IMCC14364 TaxID=3067902 RepID=UPI0027405F45|nr:glycosyltransferase family 2 protein [Parvularcula sp. IMCC14364]
MKGRLVTTPEISIVFRALNEEKWFDQALAACRQQRLDGLDFEIVLIDSGSTDRTIEIAECHDCRITHISKSEFSFGRSLNRGCAFARGQYLVFISAHCIPTHDRWLQELVQPLVAGKASYTYGRQVGHDEVTKFSEHRLFNKYFPEGDAIPQEGFFCNNANAAILREVWEQYPFDEEVTGLEDMVLAKQLQQLGHKIAYVASAPVTHVHEESQKQTQNRYYREALVLRDIMPEVHFSLLDFVRYFTVGTALDMRAAFSEGRTFSRISEIVAFRFAQYWGTYKGHNEHRKLSRAQKERYYYPAQDKALQKQEADEKDASGLDSEAYNQR